MPEKPVFTILAGPNGSGKSSSFHALQIDADFINADDIAKAMPETLAGAVRDIAAGKEALRQINQRLATASSFAYETTLSSHHSVDLMRRAKAAGFQVDLYYVTLDAPERNIQRVKFRVANGGHDIPSDVILRRYEKSIENLKLALPLADEAIIVDNSHSQPLLLWQIADGEVEELYFDEQIPLHVRLKEILIAALGIAD